MPKLPWNVLRQNNVSLFGTQRLKPPIFYPQWLEFLHGGRWEVLEETNTFEKETTQDLALGKIIKKFLHCSLWIAKWQNPIKETWNKLLEQVIHFKLLKFISIFSDTKNFSLMEMTLGNNDILTPCMMHPLGKSEFHVTMALFRLPILSSL